jgi:hypothetical protein
MRVRATQEDMGAARPRLHRAASCTGASADMAALAIVQQQAASAKLKETFASGGASKKRDVMADRSEPADADFDSPKNVAKRAALRQHPLVLKSLGLWWETAKNSMDMSRDRYAHMELADDELCREECVPPSNLLRRSYA